MIESMARTLFVLAWANEEEEAGRSPGGPGEDLMNCAPETPVEALCAAHRLVGMIEERNGLNIHSIAWFAAKSDGLDPWGEDEGVSEEFASTFGHYVAMQATGSGVQWSDYHEEVVISLACQEPRGLDIPDFEFNL